MFGPKESKPDPRLPTTETLANTQVTLGTTSEGFVAADQGNQQKIRLTDDFAGRKFSIQALNAICKALRNQLNNKDIAAVFVISDPSEIDSGTGLDSRKNPDQLTLLIYTGEIRQVRTVDTSSRIRTEKNGAGPERIDLRKQYRIAKESPLRSPKKNKPGSLLYKKKLEGYLFRLNRFPGRRVDSAVSSSIEPGGIVLDYLIQDSKPWLAYAQVSNTGTRDTGEIRALAGLDYRQLLGLDDILSVTATSSENFGETYGISGSYRLTPILPDLFKTQVYGSYTKFTASDVGQNLLNFIGEASVVGASVSVTPFHFWDTIVDVTAGFEHREVSVTNQSFFGNGGQSGFEVPYVAISAEHQSQKPFGHYLVGHVQLESGYADTNAAQLSQLGRFGLDDHFLVLRFGFGGGLYLEPLLGFIFKKQSSDSVPRNEIAVTGGGQWTAHA
jgi:hemolysin activation/secretion protein